MTDPDEKDPAAPTGEQPDFTAEEEAALDRACDKVAQEDKQDE